MKRSVRAVDVLVYRIWVGEPEETRAGNEGALYTFFKAVLNDEFG